MDIEFKFFIDEITGKSHAEMHDVSADEIHEFFTTGLVIDIPRKDGSHQAYGKLASGRYLLVPYRRLTKTLMYIITAYDIEDGEIIDAIEKELDKRS
jgi:hypothetical protein